MTLTSAIPDDLHLHPIEEGAEPTAEHAAAAAAALHCIALHAQLLWVPTCCSRQLLQQQTHLSNKLVGITI